MERGSVVKFHPASDMEYDGPAVLGDRPGVCQEGLQPSVGTRPKQTLYGEVLIQLPESCRRIGFGRSRDANTQHDRPRRRRLLA